MKAVFVFVPLLSPLLLFSQSKKEAVTSKSDTLFLTTPSIPKFAQFGKDTYQLVKTIPGTKTYILEFPEPYLLTLFQLVEQSNGSHIQVEQLKLYMREQLKSQVNSK